MIPSWSLQWALWNRGAVTWLCSLVTQRRIWVITLVVYTAWHYRMMVVVITVCITSDICPGDELLFQGSGQASWCQAKCWMHSCCVTYWVARAKHRLPVCWKTFGLWLPYITAARWEPEGACGTQRPLAASFIPQKQTHSQNQSLILLVPPAATLLWFSYYVMLYPLEQGLVLILFVPLFVVLLNEFLQETLVN